MTKLEKQVRILDITKKNGAAKMFDEQSGILFWDDIYNKEYYEVLKEMRNVFWQPQSVGMSKDVRHYDNMDKDEKELFKLAAGQLASLDSIAAVYDMYAFQYIKDPAVKHTMAFIASMETVHNESYTYILSSLVPKHVSLEAFKLPKENELMIKRNEKILSVFDNFIENPTISNFLKAQVANAALEGVSFTNGFTPFYFFMRNGKMFGSGSVIQYIQQDEIQHAYFQSMVVRDVMTQYPEENTEEFANWTYNFLKDLVEFEKDFTVDMYENIEMIDIYEVQEFIEFRANQLLDGLGLTKIFDTKLNPMPWIDAYHPSNFNNKKTDFFEGKEQNYEETSEEDNDWDDL